MNCALKEANDKKLDQKEEKDQVLDLHEQMGKTILKLGTLKISECLNIQKLIEEHNEALNASKDNGTTETIEELYKLRKTLEYKKVMLRKLMRNDTCL